MSAAAELRRRATLIQAAAPQLGSAATVHADTLRAVADRVEQEKAERDQAVKYVRRLFAHHRLADFNEDREIATFLARFPDGDCPTHEDGDDPDAGHPTDGGKS